MIRETISAAIVTLKEKGWVQGRSFGETGERCMMQAAAEHDDNFLVYDFLDNFAKGKGYRWGVDFNDAHGRTFEEVIEFLEEAKETAPA